MSRGGLTAMTDIDWIRVIIDTAVQDGTLQKTDAGYAVTEYGRAQLIRSLTTDPRFVRMALIGLASCASGGSARARAVAVELGKQYLPHISIEGLEALMLPNWKDRMLTIAADDGSMASAIIELIAPIATDREEALQVGRIIADTLLADTKA